MINVLDKNGSSLSRGGMSQQYHTGLLKGHRPEVESVLSGESDEEVIGFMDNDYSSGKRYGVVIKRQNGGAVVVNTDSEKMLMFRKAVGLGTLLKKLGSQKGIRYITLQDTLGIIAASSGVTEMARIYDDPFLLKAEKSGRSSRIIGGVGDETLEVIRPLIVDDFNLGLLRIGLSTAPIDAIRHRALRQFIVLFIAAVISGAFLIGYIILKQNYMILNAEHDRILLEVQSMEEESRRIERLSSMGRLAAGVAHEIRNPLNSVSIIAQRLKSEFAVVEDEKTYKNFLSTIGTEISRISSIVENFLRYARPPKLKLTPVRLEDIISDVLNVVGERAKKDNILITTSFDHDIKCRCDADQLKQAILNIVLNAIEAVGEDGTVSLRIEKKSDGILFTITDSGAGIPEDVLPKIFDPYFTTKDKGHGLGLSEVHRIITAHKGRIKAENVKNSGAMFSIFLHKNGEKNERSYTHR
ncbi:MAG: GHKL domain-containing protein [Candidatus Latescibacteria bacterium]|nr:GHKL domain-containing protein [Candidatus Latescibacterota bacterium]